MKIPPHLQEKWDTLVRISQTNPTLRRELPSTGPLQPAHLSILREHLWPYSLRAQEATWVTQISGSPTTPTASMSSLRLGRLI